MANPIHRINIVAKDKRSQRKVADSTTKLDKTDSRRRVGVACWRCQQINETRAYNMHMHRPLGELGGARGKRNNGKR